jgi:hypothetical protein
MPIHKDTPHRPARYRKAAFTGGLRPSRHDPPHASPIDSTFIVNRNFSERLLAYLEKNWKRVSVDLSQSRKGSFCWNLAIGQRSRPMVETLKTLLGTLLLT